VHAHHTVKVCHVLQKGTQRWPSPGVDKVFAVTEATVALALKLLRTARGHLSAMGWRVFDGDLDLKNASGSHKGAVDGIADKDEELTSLALVELKAGFEIR
jgi:hypothetical protein